MQTVSIVRRAPSPEHPSLLESSFVVQLGNPDSSTQAILDHCGEAKHKLQARRYAQPLLQYHGMLWPLIPIVAVDPLFPSFT